MIPSISQHPNGRHDKTPRQSPTDVVLAGGSPAAEARSITGRPYLSWTQVSSYQQCPRAFAFGYVEHADPDFVPSSLLFGSAMHEAFAKVHEHDMEGLPVPSSEDLAGEVSNLLNSSLLPVRYSKGESAESLHALGQRMVDAFLAAPESKPEGQPVCIEDRASGISDPQIPPIEGKVDFVRLTRDGLVLRDYKTSRSRWNSDKAAHQRRWLIAAASACETQNGAAAERRYGGHHELSAQAEWIAPLV